MKNLIQSKKDINTIKSSLQAHLKISSSDKTRTNMYQAIQFIKNEDNTFQLTSTDGKVLLSSKVNFDFTPFLIESSNVYIVSRNDIKNFIHVLTNNLDKSDDDKIKFTFSSKEDNRFPTYNHITESCRDNIKLNGRDNFFNTNDIVKIIEATKLLNYENINFQNTEKYGYITPVKGNNGLIINYFELVIVRL